MRRTRSKFAERVGRIILSVRSRIIPDLSFVSEQATHWCVGYTHQCVFIMFGGDMRAGTTVSKHHYDARERGFWDRIGMGLSGVCVVHCLLAPVVLSLLPLFPVGEAFHAWMHPVFAVVLVPTTGLAFRSAWRKHRDWKVLSLLAVGLPVILAAGVVGHEAPGALTETSITVVGSMLLIAGHWRNWRLTRSCRLRPAAAPRYPLSGTESKPHVDATSQLYSRRGHRRTVGEPC